MILRSAALFPRMAVCCFALLTGACGLLPDRIVEEPASENEIIPLEHADLVARNLVYALAQLKETNPRHTTVQYTEPGTLFGRMIKLRLEDAGYGMQQVSTDIGSNYVRYQYLNSITESGPVTRFTLSIGFTRADRVYIVKNGAIFPDAEMMLSGASEVLVKNNDSIFSEQDEFHKFSSETFFEVDGGPEPVVLTASAEVTPAPENHFASSIRKNLHDNNEVSNFAMVFDDYLDVHNVVLIFPNDKMTVGANNKKAIRELAAQHRSETDIFSVIGCSHGKTQLAGGNVALAIGRAQRVKEELLLSQIPYEQIYEEGCWGKVHHENFPRRGVVITLKRRNS